MLFGKLAKGGTVLVKIEDNKIAFEFPEGGPKKPTKKKGDVPDDGKGGGGLPKTPVLAK